MEGEITAHPARSPWLFLGKFSHWLLVSRHPLPCVAFGVFLYCLIYRAWFYFELYYFRREQAAGLGFLPEVSSKLTLATAPFKDAIVALLLGCVFWGVQRVLVAPLSRRHLRSAKVLSYGGLCLILLAVSVCFALYREMLWQLGTAPTIQLIAYAFQVSSVSEFLSYGTFADFILITLVIPAYLIQFLIPDRQRAVLRVILVMATTASLIAFPLLKHENMLLNEMDKKSTTTGAAPPTLRPVSLTIVRNPVIALIKSLVQRPPNSFLDMEKLPSMTQAVTPTFLDPSFTTAPPPQQDHYAANGSDWNLVVIQMEGVNRGYALDQNQDTDANMPFLSSLARRSLVLQRHFSTGPDTDVGVLSLFTGLYPVTHPINIAVRSDLHLPTLFSFVSRTHSSFLVTAGDLRLWYPVGVLRNSGLQRIWDVQNTPGRTHHLLFLSIKDERETAQFFVKQLRSAARPFVGIYYPYATHTPYSLYDQSVESIERLTPRDRYLRNLRLVDSQIELIFNALKEMGVLDKTIIVVTADHGEAFGENGSFGHGMHLFNIATNVPMLIYQPKLFKAGNCWEVTSHADIVPTLLDAMSIRYSEGQFEGESVLRVKRRKYVFLYAPKSDQLASVSKDKTKLIVDYMSGLCTAFDLASDFGETRPLNCDAYRVQLEALLMFRMYHTQMLLAYNSSCAAGNAYNPEIVGD